MQQFNLVIQNPTGLHARPARFLVEIAKKFQSSIRVRYGEKQVNAKSLVSLLTLGVPFGQQIQVDVTGEDEEAAASALTAAVQEGLGEGRLTAHQPVLSISQDSRWETATPQPKESKTLPAANFPERHVGITTGKIIQGVAAAGGIAIGTVYLFERRPIMLAESAPLNSINKNQERQRLQVALEMARHQLVTLCGQVAQKGLQSELEIFEAHQAILSDTVLLDSVNQLLDSGHNAASAWQVAYTEQANALSSVTDSLLAERAVDIRDVGERVLRLLTGTPETFTLPQGRPVIIVADDLTPSETAELDPQQVLGFCTVGGGLHAHTAILARALGIPAIVNAGSQIMAIPDATPVILNGYTGMLTIAPDEATLATARAEQVQEQASKEVALRSATTPACTTDGHTIEIAANIGGLAEANLVRGLGGDGVGLLRTEFLFLDRTTAPTEEEQFRVYRDIALALQGAPLIIRTLDIGGDKPLPYLKLPTEANPFLGLRGIRLCLAQPELFRPQLRAILRSAAFGKIRVMFPMISDIAELRTAKALLTEIQTELGIPASAVEVGIMIEVPSAALMADILAPEVDFFSIGTNDLTQYTLAMDRTNANLGTADGLHPAVLRLIARTIEAAHAAGKWVGICGELAGDQKAVPILLGLGVDELSVSSPLIPTLKAQIRLLNYTDCQALAQAALC